MVNLRACLKKDNPKSTGSLPFPLLSHFLRQFFKGYHHLGITIPLRIRGITIGITISLPRYTIPLISPGKKTDFSEPFAASTSPGPRSLFAKNPKEQKDWSVMSKVASNAGTRCVGILVGFSWVPSYI